MTRSWLFVPGDSARKLARGIQSGADALIIDWEDAVGPANKPAARALTNAFLLDLKPGVQRIFIRVNALGSRFIEEDLAALPVDRIDGIVLPKSCGTAHIAALSVRLDLIEAQGGLAAGQLRIVPVATETAASVLALHDFRAPLARLEGLMWGAEDLAADIGVFQNRDKSGAYRPPFLVARQLTVLAAGAAQCAAIDAVFTDFRDLDRLDQECRMARADGFVAKAAIHPDQIAVIHAAFKPSADEIQWAERIVAALDAQTGVGVVDGVMVDLPHLRLAQRLLG